MPDVPIRGHSPVPSHDALAEVGLQAGGMQTIEEIEAQAGAIRQAEADAMVDLAAWLRDAAVQLPAQSKLPVAFAKAAKGAELWLDTDYPGQGLWDTERLIKQMGEEAATELLEQLARALRRTLAD